jgi:putative peptidoglycan lipid II flippase
MSKKQLLQKTALISASTMLSRILGIIRETLTIQFLGATALADAFLTAFKIPNTLRKAFAEGALSAAAIPVLAAKLHDHDKKSINGLMTLLFIVFESIVFLLCIIGIIWSESVIRIIAPGFCTQTATVAAQLLRIVMPFIATVSMSALFAGALQSDNRFLIPALAPVFLNGIIISTLIICLGFKMPVSFLCWGILCGGILQCGLHLYAYLRAGFGFASFNWTDIKIVRTVVVRFLLCLPSISLMELSSFIDTSFASCLKPGSISLLYLANRFIGIPLGVFAVAFATVMLPHMSRVVTFSPKRLSFYLLEGAKLVFWVCLPAMLMMSFFAKPLFATLFLSSNKFSLAQVEEAATILRAFILGLFFFSFNKVILNAYYALQITWVPALIASITALLNIVLDWLFIDHFHAIGLAFATTLSAMIQTIILLMVLWYGYKRTVYLHSLLTFMASYCIQVLVFFIPFLGTYYYTEHFIHMHMSTTAQTFLLQSLGYWLWVAPLGLLYMISLWFTRHLINKKIYFLQ